MNYVDIVQVDTLLFMLVRYIKKIIIYLIMLNNRMFRQRLSHLDRY